MRRVLARALFALAAAVGGSIAWAHAHLVAAEPAAGSVVGSATELRLHFSEAVEAKYSSVKLTDAAGRAVAATVSGIAEKGELNLRPATALAPGDYRVEWSVLTADGHRSRGGYGLTVQPAGPH